MARRTLRVFAVAALLSLLAVPGWGQSDAGYDAYKRGDYTTAHRVWKSLADRGDASAQYNLGLLYHHGLGVKRQLGEAAKWYARAAENGDADAQKAIGDLYLKGFWGKKNYAKAATWYRKAAKQGHAEAKKSLRKLGAKGQGRPRQATPPQAKYRFGVAAYDRGDYAEAVKWYRKSADQGNALAQLNLGFMYNEGQGVPQDYAEAVKWYRKSADQGNAPAQYNLGYMYYRGRGVRQDHGEAIRWIRAAAEQGLAPAQGKLAAYYVKSWGVMPRDLVQAYMWYTLSAAQGFKASAISLAPLERFMSPAQVAEANRLARDWRRKKGKLAREWKPKRH